MKATERWGFAAAGFGQNLVFNLVNIYVLVYLVGGLGLSPTGVAKVTGVLTAAKIWDAVADLLIGVFIDRTRTRWGRFRPYILATAAPIAVLAILLFHVPATSENAQVVYFGIVYVLFASLYTLADVPYWAMTGAITTDDRSRTALISAARTAGAVSLALATLAGTPLARALSFGPETTAAGWGRAAMILGGGGMALFTLSFFTTTEKVPVPDTTPTLGGTLRLMAGNGPLVRLVASGALGFGRFMLQVGGAVMALVVFGDERYFTLLGAALIVAMIVATVLTPVLLRHMTRRTLMIGSSGAAGAVSLLMWLVGYRSLPVVALMAFLTGALLGVFLVTQTAMFGDAADAGELRTGTRHDGVCFAGLTFLTKFDGAVATVVFGLAVATVGYTKGAPVTPAMRDGVWAATTLPAAFSCLAGIVPLLGYRVPEREMPALLAAARTRAGLDVGDAGFDEAPVTDG